MDRPLLALSTLVLLAPFALAHGALEASELEVELLQDETTDAVYATGGYDVGQVFLGEAHVRDVGEGAAGDGLYFRANLAGQPSPEGPARIVFSFETPGGAIERTITVAGEEVASDFDALAAELGSDELVVERAFLSYASAGVAPGDTLSGFRVATYAGSRQVDVAPGGFHAGPVPLPMGDSLVVTEEVVLAGTGRYLDVVAELEGDEVKIVATSLLKKGEQHLEVHIADGAPVETLGETSVSVKPQGVAEFRLRLLGEARFDVTTDVGGREGIVAAPGEVRAEDGTLLSARSETGGANETPVAPWLALMAVGIALLAARRR